MHRFLRAWGLPVGANEALIIGICPFEYPDARLVVALCRAGALGVLDLGRGGPRSCDALRASAKETPCGFGVRVRHDCAVDPRPLPAEVEYVVLPAGVATNDWEPRRVIVQVTSEAEAREAIRNGAYGLIAKGCESGGKVGDESTFILLQRLVREFNVPIWAQGGIGLHTAAAAVAGGAAGVVIDNQLALVRESTLPDVAKDSISKMDGSETTLVGGHRVFTPPHLRSARHANETREGTAAHVGGADLMRSSLPAGQDAAFARPLAERYSTAADVVRAIREAITGHISQAQSSNPLAPHAPLAAANRVRYPIVQGPMTRVSDQPAFAAAVADAGGIPFLALALMRGEQLHVVLAETAARLEGRTWGAGILGFVPAELREEQVAAIQRVRPPLALIAGGRPSQARSLEAAGIETYLHVPSPGLLEYFLNDGARRFVFEGSECGGHVGPRTSFSLWESQIECLLAFDQPHELSVLFASGIHDGASAAMVAAMAAPLAAVAVRVGVLMGTAYVLTREAVEFEAILPAYQTIALECQRTDLPPRAVPHPMLVPAPVEGREGRASSGTRATA